MGRSPGGAPVLGEKGFKRVGGGWISLECCTHAARWQSISCYRPEGTVESCARDRTATPGLEPWRFRDAFGATWGAPIRVPGGGRKHSEEQQVGRTVSAYHSRGGTYIASTIRISHSESTSPAPSSIDDGCGSPSPALPIQEFDWLNPCWPPMPIRTTFRLVDWGTLRPVPSRFMRAIQACAQILSRFEVRGVSRRKRYRRSGPGIAADACTAET